MSNVDIFTYNGNTGQQTNHVQVPKSTFSDTIAANLQNHLTQIENFIAANPGGAILTAAQTLFVAQTLAGIIRLLLVEVTTVGQAN